MPVTVRLFATLKDAAGFATTEVDLPAGSTVQALLDRLAEAHPPLAKHLPHALIAVNEEYTFPEETVPEGAQVALFPPVSGGAHPDYFAVTAEPLDLNAVVAAITRPDTGGIGIFHGVVRGQTDKPGHPAQTEHLVYEAYSPMAEKKMAQIAAEIRERWPAVKGVAIVQRIGHLQIGDMTTFVACAAGHRTDGIFEAARYGIDRLKQIVPVWKKEVGPDGSTWIEGDYRPTPDDVRE
ncbi:MAG: molybdenum cofactor biosynthesis protein MoaE [Anaerolineae bacterium]